MRAIFSAVLFILLSACGPEAVYEQNRDLAGAKWNIKDSLLFEFPVPDSTIQYNLYYNVRYNTDYKYYNLYVRHDLYDSSGNMLDSQLMNMDLFDPVDGDPKGSGISNIFDYRILFLNNFKFPHTGTYKLKAIQYMREDPLEGIEAFGLRVEKN